MNANSPTKWLLVSCLFTPLACQRAVEPIDEARVYCNVWTDAAKTDKVKQSILGTWQFTYRSAGFSGQTVETRQIVRLTFSNDGTLRVEKNNNPARSLTNTITEGQVTGFDKRLLRLTLSEAIPAAASDDVAITDTNFYVCNNQLVFDSGSWRDAPTDTFTRLH